MNIPSEQWTSILKAVFTKATSDADFRARCLSDPAAAVKEAAGVELPAGIKFADQADGTSVVLPPFGADPDEISDVELLDGVSGGAGPQGSMMCKSIQWCG